MVPTPTYTSLKAIENCEKDENHVSTLPRLTVPHWLTFANRYEEMLKSSK